MKIRRKSVSSSLPKKRVRKFTKRWLEAQDISGMALAGSTPSVKTSQAAYVQMHSSAGSDNCAFMITNDPANGYRIVAVSTLALNGETSWSYQPGSPVHLEMSIMPVSGVVTFWKDGSPVCTTQTNSSFAAGASSVRFGSRAAPGDRLLKTAFSGVHIAQGTVANNALKIKYRAPNFDSNPQALFQTNGAYQVKKISKKSFVFRQQ